MLIPGFPSIFRITRHRRFDYKPLYYNEEKEKRAERAREPGHGDAAGSRNRIRFLRSTRRSSRISNLRIILLVIALGALAAYIMNR